MIPALNTALTGLNAAEKRLSVSANNIANIDSTGKVENGIPVSEPYSAQRVNQVSQSDGGVIIDISNANPGTVTAFRPDDAGADENGFVQAPNVNLENEVIQQKMAGYDFKANLKTIQATDENFKNLLDIVA